MTFSVSRGAGTRISPRFYPDEDRGGLRGGPRRGPGGADALHDGRLPRSRVLFGGRRRLRRRWSRPDRAGGPVLRSPCRRADDPCRRHRGAGGGRHSGHGAGGVRVGCRSGAGRSHGLRQHGAGARGGRRVRPPRGGGRAPPGRSSPTCRWGRPRTCARTSPPRAWRWCRWWHRRPRPSAAPRSAPPLAASSTSSPRSARRGSGGSFLQDSPSWSRRRRAESEVPVAVGFGIGTPAQAAEVGRIADGVIVGSRLVRAAGEAGSPEQAAEAVGTFLRETRAALAS